LFMQSRYYTRLLLYCHYQYVISLLLYSVTQALKLPTEVRILSYSKRCCLLKLQYWIKASAVAY
jgi:hypothetical protein